MAKYLILFSSVLLSLTLLSGCVENDEVSKTSSTNTLITSQTNTDLEKDRLARLDEEEAASSNSDVESKEESNTQESLTDTTQDETSDSMDNEENSSASMQADSRTDSVNLEPVELPGDIPSLLTESDPLLVPGNFSYTIVFTESTSDTSDLLREIYVWKKDSKMHVEMSENLSYYLDEDTEILGVYNTDQNRITNFKGDEDDISLQIAEKTVTLSSDIMFSPDEYQGQSTLEGDTVYVYIQELGNYKVTGYYNPATNMIVKTELDSGDVQISYSIKDYTINQVQDTDVDYPESAVIFDESDTYFQEALLNGWGIE